MIMTRASREHLKALGKRLFGPLEEVSEADIPSFIKDFVKELKENHPIIGHYVVDVRITVHPHFIKLIPELGVAALKAKVDKELALWFELRSINSWGSGNLDLKDAIVALTFSFNYSKRTVYRILKAGKGKFWDIYQSPRLEGRSVIKMYGVFRVAQHLKSYHLGRPVEIPTTQFKGLQNRRACLYASFFKPQGCRAKPISRDSIHVATGVKRKQQRRYEQVARIRRVANFALQEIEGQLYPMYTFVEGKAKQWKVLRRLGNMYHSQAFRARRGMIKKVNALLRQRSFCSDEARLPKRFFLIPQSVTRTPERADEAFLLLNRKNRLIKNRLEWCLL